MIVLSLPFLSAFSAAWRSHRTRKMDSRILVCLGRPWRILGETPAGLVSSSGLIGLLSPNTMSCYALRVTRLGLWTTIMLAPSLLRSETSPFPPLTFGTIWSSPRQGTPHLETMFNAQKTHS